MTKLEFIAAFTSACDNMPRELLDAALADYERQFTDQLLSGQSERAIVDGWGAPQTAALKLKLQTLNGNLAQPLSGAKVLRVVMAGAGLAVLDFFLLIPASFVGFLLTSLFLLGSGAYLGGIFVTVSSLVGVNYIEVPQSYFPAAMFSHVDIGSVRIDPDVIVVDTPVLAMPHSSTNITPDIIAFEDAGQHQKQTLHIATNLHKNAVWNGLGITLTGMMLLVLGLLAVRLSFRLLGRFIGWHLFTLKNA